MKTSRPGFQLAEVERREEDVRAQRKQTVMVAQWWHRCCRCWYCVAIPSFCPNHILVINPIPFPHTPTSYFRETCLYLPRLSIIFWQWYTAVLWTGDAILPSTGTVANTRHLRGWWEGGFFPSPSRSIGSKQTLALTIRWKLPSIDTQSTTSLGLSGLMVAFYLYLRWLGLEIENVYFFLHLLVFSHFSFMSPTSGKGKMWLPLHWHSFKLSPW